MKKLILKIFSVFFFLLPTSYLLTPTCFAAVTRPVFFAIEPQYQAARDFHEGLAAVKQDDRWGYIDYLGRVAVPFVHRVPEAGDFSEGFAFVGDHYIDTTGTPAFTIIDEDTDERIEKFFTNGLPFSQGLAAVQSGGQWGFIDLAGNYVIVPMFMRAGSFSENLAPVMANDGLWGYIDMRGNYVIEPKFLRAGEFHEGLALVNIKGRWGYINKEGKVAIKASYYEAGFFNFGLAPVRTRRSYRGWGFISHKNKFAIPRWFNNLGNFGEGLAPAAADTRWGFINVRGDWEITPQFEDARSFSEGLAAVRVENSWGFIRQ